LFSETFSSNVTASTFLFTLSGGLSPGMIWIIGMPASCPFFYLKSATLIINQCDSTCGGCSISSDNCTTCASGYSFTGVNSTTCAICSGYTAGDPPVCYPCTSPCLTCNVSGTNCTSCIPQYYHDGSESCLSCHLTCLTCFSPSALGCLSCGVDGSSIQLYLDATIGTCSSTCATDYLNDTFGVESARYQCNVCDSACIRCSAAGDANNCT